MDFLLQNIEFVLFITLLCVFLYVKRKQLDVQGSIPSLYILLFKTQAGLKQMKSWSKQRPGIFNFLAYLSIFVGVSGIFAIIPFLMYQLYFMFQNNITNAGGFALPLTGSVCSNPLVFCIPFWYWLIALFVLVVVHEFAHGVIAQRYGIKIKSSGLAFFGSTHIIGAIFLAIIAFNYSLDQIIGLDPSFITTVIIGLVLMFLPIMPGAFVEPDEKQMAKKPKWQQIAVLGAGSTSNFLFGVLFFIILVFVAAPFQNAYTDQELYFNVNSNQSDLLNYNISEGTIISVNGATGIGGIYDEFTNISPNQTLLFEVETNNTIVSQNITTFASEDGSRGLIGIGLATQNVPLEGKELPAKISDMFFQTFFWLFVLNISIGAINLLPLWITDGGKIAHLLFQYKFSEKTTLRLYNIVSFISLIMLFISLFPQSIFIFFG
ncbi:MAG: M50 family metallopeptidase [Nanoarchaeota archaeon]|nr:M50 family metallopeptidase [Nanoarchaeota archaeon]